MVKILGHRDFISGSCHRKIIPSLENINNIPFAFHTAQRKVRGGFATRKAAFTLAEVLITLGIIGVVAAMTLPTLIQNYKRKEATTRLKKGYSVLSQAITQSIVANGEIQYWEKTGEQFSEDGSSDYVANGELSYNFFMKYLAPYMKYIKIDKAVELEDPDAVHEYELKVTLADGSILYVHNGACIDVNIDINGENNPNKSGYDIFNFLICTSASKKNMYCSDSKNWFCTYSTAGYKTRDQFVVACKTDKRFCSRLLQIDNWEFKNDYPHKL